jgi:hypothetical protein
MYFYIYSYIYYVDIDIICNQMESSLGLVENKFNDQWYKLIYILLLIYTLLSISIYLYLGLVCLVVRDRE